MACITVRLSADALAFMRQKVPGRTGIGAFLSSLVLAERAREETRAALAQQATRPLSSKKSWSQTGINVD